MKVLGSHGRWWFEIFFIFTPKIGEMIQFDEYFSDGLKPPTRYVHPGKLTVRPGQIAIVGKIHLTSPGM